MFLCGVTVDPPRAAVVLKWNRGFESLRYVNGLLEDGFLPSRVVEASGTKGRKGAGAAAEQQASPVVPSDLILLVWDAFCAATNTLSNQTVLWRKDITFLKDGVLRLEQEGVSVELTFSPTPFVVGDAGAGAGRAEASPGTRIVSPTADGAQRHGLSDLPSLELPVSLPTLEGALANVRGGARHGRQGEGQKSSTSTDLVALSEAAVEQSAAVLDPSAFREENRLLRGIASDNEGILAKLRDDVARLERELARKPRVGMLAEMCRPGAGADGAAAPAAETGGGRTASFTKGSSGVVIALLCSPRVDSILLMEAASLHNCRKLFLLLTHAGPKSAKRAAPPARPQQNPGVTRPVLGRKQIDTSLGGQGAAWSTFTPFGDGERTASRVQVRMTRGGPGGSSAGDAASIAGAGGCAVGRGRVGGSAKKGVARRGSSGCEQAVPGAEVDPPRRGSDAISGESGVEAAQHGVVEEADESSKENVQPPAGASGVGAAPSASTARKQATLAQKFKAAPCATMQDRKEASTTRAAKAAGALSAPGVAGHGVRQFAKSQARPEVPALAAPEVPKKHMGPPGMIGGPVSGVASTSRKNAASVPSSQRPKTAKSARAIAAEGVAAGATIGSSGVEAAGAPSRPRSALVGGRGKVAAVSSQWPRKASGAGREGGSGTGAVAKEIRPRSDLLKRIMRESGGMGGYYSGAGATQLEASSSSTREQAAALESAAPSLDDGAGEQGRGAQAGDGSAVEDGTMVAGLDSSACAEGTEDGGGPGAGEAEPRECVEAQKGQQTGGAEDPTSAAAEGAPVSGEDGAPGSARALASTGSAEEGVPGADITGDGGAKVDAEDDPNDITSGAQAEEDPSDFALGILGAVCNPEDDITLNETHDIVDLTLNQTDMLSSPSKSPVRSRNRAPGRGAEEVGTASGSSPTKGGVPKIATASLDVALGLIAPPAAAGGEATREDHVEGGQQTPPAPVDAQSALVKGVPVAPVLADSVASGLSSARAYVGVAEADVLANLRKKHELEAQLKLKLSAGEGLPSDRTPLGPTGPDVGKNPQPSASLLEDQPSPISFVVGGGGAGGAVEGGLLLGSPDSDGALVFDADPEGGDGGGLDGSDFGGLAVDDGELPSFDGGQVDHGGASPEKSGDRDGPQAFNESGTAAAAGSRAPAPKRESASSKQQRPRSSSRTRSGAAKNSSATSTPGASVQKPIPKELQNVNAVRRASERRNVHPHPVEALLKRDDVSVEQKLKAYFHTAITAFRALDLDCDTVLCYEEFAYGLQRFGVSVDEVDELWEDVARESGFCRFVDFQRRFFPRPGQEFVDDELDVGGSSEGGRPPGIMGSGPAGAPAPSSVPERFAGAGAGGQQQEGAGSGLPRSLPGGRARFRVRVMVPLRLREKPKSSASVLGVLEEGEVFDVLHTAGEWLQLRYIQTCVDVDVAPEAPGGGDGGGAVAERVVILGWALRRQGPMEFLQRVGAPGLSR